VIINERQKTVLPERLDTADFESVRKRVFRDRISTLDEEASPFSLDDLRLGLGVVRVGLRSEAQCLPDRAFEERPADSNGNEVWTAGQIVNHIGHAQIEMTTWLHTALGLEANNTPHPLMDLTDAGEPGRLTREQTFHVLDVADRELETLFDAIPERIHPYLCARHPAFGIAGVKGGLLIMAIHEHSHLDQLIGLRA
jgi:hypothetical protein